jgi:capsular exopolysaccharide synthesis family protein
MNSSGYKSKSGETRIYEAYKQVRVNLLYALATSNSNIIVITSPSPAEGKSTTATNLATVISQTHARVLLIDADMRKPILHKYLHTPNKVGLSLVLSNMCKLEEAIVQVHPPYMDLLTAGYIPPNPAELLSSDKMAEVLRVLSAKYDYVVIDTPPVNLLSDGLALVNKTAGVVMVVRQKKTKYNDLKHAIDLITNINGKILGVIINDVKDNFKSYNYQKYNYYYK